MKSGTFTVLPVSSMAGLVTFDAVSPRRPSGASTTFNCTDDGNSTCTGLAFGVENLDRQIFDEVILRLAEQIIVQA